MIPILSNTTPASTSSSISREHLLQQVDPHYIETLPGAVPPSLTAPSDLVCSEYALLHAIEGLSSLKESFAEGMIERLDHVKHALETQSTLLMRQLKEAADQSQRCDFWSLLKRAGQSLLSAMSMLFGFSLVATSPHTLVGGALITSGMLSLANQALIECKGWNWVTEQLAPEDPQLRQQLLTYLPMTVGWMAAGCSLAGSVYGVTTGALNASQQAGSILNTAITAFATGTQLGAGISQAQLNWMQAGLTLVQEKQQIEQTEYNILANAVENFLNQLNASIDYARRSVHAILRTRSELT